MQFDLFRFVLQCYQFLIVLIINKNSENFIKRSQSDALQEKAFVHVHVHVVPHLAQKG